MINTTITPSPRRDPAPDHHASHSGAHQQNARRFRALLDDAPQPEAPLPQWLAAPIVTLPSLPDSDAATAAPLRPAGLREAERPPAPAPALDAQTLELRVSLGPLAGLLVQASWQGQRLGLRLSAPAGALTERLQREGEPLAAVLSAALGVDVQLEVQHER